MAEPRLLDLHRLTIEAALKHELPTEPARILPAAEVKREDQGVAAAHGRSGRFPSAAFNTEHPD